MMMVYFLLFLAARTGTISRTKFNVGIELSATILSIYGVMQCYGLDPFPRDFIRARWRTAFSTFGNPNFFGSYLVLVIPIALDSFIRRRKDISGLVYSILIYALLLHHAPEAPGSGQLLPSLHTSLPADYLQGIADKTHEDSYAY